MGHTRLLSRSFVCAPKWLSMWLSTSLSRSLFLATALLAISFGTPAHAAIAAQASPAAAGESSPRAVDQAAIEAYRRGDLESARSLWLSELEPAATAPSDAEAARDGRIPAALSPASSLSSTERARILYDLGNVAYRKKQILEAVGWYTAALRLSPRDPDVWWNLEHARSEAKLEPADRGDLSATLRRLFTSLTVGESEWLVLGALALWAGVLAVEALRGGRTWRRLSFAGACVVLVSLGPWIFHLASDAQHPLLAIQQGKLQVLSEPRADAPAIAEVAAGEELEALDALPEWTKVELPNGLQGWARKSALFALDR